MTRMPASADGSTVRPTVKRPEPDGSGQAALLLAESTLHVLVEARVLTADQARDAVRTAAAVTFDIAKESGERSGAMQPSLDLLGRIERSMAALDASDT